MFYKYSLSYINCSNSGRNLLNIKLSKKLLEKASLKNFKEKVINDLNSILLKNVANIIVMAHTIILKWKHEV